MTTIALEEPIADTVKLPSEHEIRTRAYELYEIRGREDGHAEDDWYQAESELLDRAAKKRVA